MDLVQKSALRGVVRGHYDAQKLRMQTGCRIIANLKVKLGQAPGKPEKTISKEGQKLLEQLRASHKRITDSFVDKRPYLLFKNFKGDSIISNTTEYALANHYVKCLEVEEGHKYMISQLIKDVPIYQAFLVGVKGCGPVLSSVLYTELDPYKAKYPSSFWRYAGLDVAEDGEGRTKKKKHLIKVQYTDKNGKLAVKDSITYNPFLKSKLLGVLGGQFLRHKGEKYCQLYHGYRNRLDNHPKHKDKTPGHRYKMSLRYAVKIFLVDLHIAWRELEGLPVYGPYSEGKLGIKHENN